MSRIGKKPIEVPKGVDVQINGRAVKVKGPKGELNWTYPVTAKVSFDDGSRQLTVERTGDDRQSRANHGLTRSLIANMVEGVHQGYQKRLEIYGTGYGCKMQGNVLHLNCGFMGRALNAPAQFVIPVPAGLEVVVEVPAARGDSDPAKMLIKGHDKQQVGQFAAEIRALRKTEPYNGKGIRYEGEYIKRKQGKALSGGG